jgi:alkylhydroperoxidase/carboxymuconolactone decarboxylase family protein YurZ
MATLQPIQPNQATGEAKALFDDILQRLPRVPNMLATLAHSPTILSSYLAFTESFNSQLPERLRDLISLTVAQVMGGDYILSFAHVLAKKEGISEEQVAAAVVASLLTQKQPYCCDSLRKLPASMGAFLKAILRHSGWPVTPRSSSLTSWRTFRFLSSAFFSTSWLKHPSTSRL